MTEMIETRMRTPDPLRAEARRGSGWWWALLALVPLAACAAASSPRADPLLHRLWSAQIRKRFAGQVLTDGTHWRETYATGGNS